jgi:hypothetical protein
MEKKKMTMLKLLSAGLIAAAVFATPAMARQQHATARSTAANADVIADPGFVAEPGASYIPGQTCYPAPRVGAFATQPWDNAPPCSPVFTPAY